VGLPAAAKAAVIAPTGGPSRRRIFGDRVRGAKISAEHARQRAKEAAREADAAECLLWSEQMEAFGGTGAAVSNHRSVPQRRLSSAFSACCIGIIGCYLADSRSAHADGGACHLLGEDLLLRNRFAWAALITHAFAKLRARTYPTKARGFVSHKLSRPRLTSANLLHAGLSEEFDAKRLWPPIWKSFYHRLSA
jgi:hypothetical protein